MRSQYPPFFTSRISFVYVGAQMEEYVTRRYRISLGASSRVVSMPAKWRHSRCPEGVRVLENTSDRVAYFWLSTPEQASSMIWSNGASCSVCLGTTQGLVSTFGSSRVASISRVFASTRR